MPMRVHGHVGVLQGLKTSILPRLGIGATAHTIINVSRSPHPYGKRFATGNQLLLRALQTPLHSCTSCRDVCWRVLHVCLLGCQVHLCRNAKTPGALVWKRKIRRSRKTKDSAHATPVSRQVVASDKLWCADKGDWIERAYLGPSLALCLCLKIDLSIPRNILDVAGISSP